MTCDVSDNCSKEALLKGKAKYRWPPHTNWWSSADFILKNILTFLLLFINVCENKMLNTHQVCPNFLILKHLAACLPNGTAISHWRGRLSTVDLHASTNLDELVFILEILLTFFAKQKHHFIYLLFAKTKRWTAHQVCPNFLILKHLAVCLTIVARKHY